MPTPNYRLEYHRVLAETETFRSLLTYCISVGVTGQSSRLTSSESLAGIRQRIPASDSLDVERLNHIFAQKIFKVRSSTNAVPHSRR